MSLKQWLWLLVWLLIFLILFCVWDKLNYFKDNNSQIVQTTPTVQTIKDNESNDQTTKHRDVYLKIIKDQEAIKISGIFPNKEAADKIVSAYSKLSPSVDTSDIMIHKDAQNDEIIDLAISMQDELSQFDSGYIDYSDKKLVIDGITDNENVKENILKKASSLTGITLDNKVIVRDNANKQDSDEAILEDINDIKDSLHLNKGIPTIASELKDKNIDSNANTKPDNQVKSSNKIKEESKNRDNKANLDENSDKNSNSGANTKENKQKEIKKIASQKRHISKNKKQNSSKNAQKELNNILKYKKVEFVYAKDRLTKKGQRVINRVVKVLNKYKNINIEIGGHTDSDGTKSRNRILSKRRANAIKTYLTKKGIASSRLKAVGYGESRPIVKNDSAKNKQKNRRVEFKVMGEK